MVNDASCRNFAFSTKLDQHFGAFDGEADISCNEV